MWYVTHCPRWMFRRHYAHIHTLLTQLEQFPKQGLIDYSLYSDAIQFVCQPYGFQTNGINAYKAISKTTFYYYKYRYASVTMTVLKAEELAEHQFQVRLFLEGQALVAHDEEWVFQYVYNKDNKITKHILKEKSEIPKPIVPRLF